MRFPSSVRFVASAVIRRHTAGVLRHVVTQNTVQAALSSAQIAGSTGSTINTFVFMETPHYTPRQCRFSVMLVEQVCNGHNCYEDATTKNHAATTQHYLLE